MKAKLILILFTWAMPFLGVNAQKLPNIQTSSIWAPASIKIDRKAYEWNCELQAHNKATQLFYAIANNNDFLFITIKVSDPDIITKFVRNGLTFKARGINTKNEISITYPVYEKKEPEMFFLFKGKPQNKKDSISYKLQLDSFKRTLNQKLPLTVKWIGVSGIKEIPDSIISVYNDMNVKIVSTFDNQLNYLCKIAIPLRYFPMLNNVETLKYNIMLNGFAEKKQTMQLSSSGRFFVLNDQNGGAGSVIPVIPQTQAMAYATDFWGEYTLAKKP